MPRLTRRLPSYRLHRASGQAIVTINGRDIYLGRHGTVESKAEYDRIIEEWLANHRQTAPVTSNGRSHEPSTSINELVLAFWDHATSYYVKNGEPTREIQALKYSFRPLVELYGATETAQFTPRALKAVRQRMIDQNLARTLINKRITRVRHLFKWGVANELVPPGVLDALRAVAPLKRGRCNVRESAPVKPAPQHLVDAIEPHVSRQVWAMVQLQLFTGMRPGEVVAMRRGDLDISGKVWLYRPGSHKTEHHGHERRVYLGPQAQMVLMKFLNRSNEAYLFSPVEAEEDRRAKQHAARRTPLSCGNRPGSNRRRSPKRKARACYDVGSYRRAIERGCGKAFPWPKLNGRAVKELPDEERAERKAWRDAHGWHPHQLRHNAATFLRKEFGIEAARLILGHRSTAITEIYAELDHERAASIMSQVG